MSTPFRRNWIMREEPPWMGFDVVFAQSLGPVWLSLSPELYSPPASSVCGISQARILERIPFSRESSQPRDQTWVSCNCRQVLYHWATREVHEWDECSYKRDPRELSRALSTMWGHNEKSAVCNLKEPDHADTSTLDFQPPELREIA